MNLKHKAALITGASRGLGRALAEALAARGAPVVLTARDPEPLREATEAIRARGGVAHALPADVGRKDAVYPLVASAAALVGPLDIVIHNASTLGPTPLRPLLDSNCEDLAEVLEVNLVGPFRISKAVAGSMAVRGHGTLVHISSDASVRAYDGWGLYSVSKAALDHLARLWAAELDGFGVRVFSVDPGEMNTLMHREAVPDQNPEQLKDPRDVAERIALMLEQAERIPSGARIEADSWKP